MKWMLILVLYGPNNSIMNAKLFPEFKSQEECKYNGEQAEQYYKRQGLVVKHKCVTEV